MDFVPAAAKFVFAAVVVKVATPPLSVAVPPVMAVFAFLNVTVPVGVPDEAETVAVNVTACPKVEGFSDEVRATVVAMVAAAGPATPSSASAKRQYDAAARRFAPHTFMLTPTLPL
jgi:hypothetical protein